jgi:hypothetical protein
MAIFFNFKASKTRIKAFKTKQKLPDPSRIFQNVLGSADRISLTSTQMCFGPLYSIKLDSTLNTISTDTSFCPTACYVLLYVLHLAATPIYDRSLSRLTSALTPTVSVTAKPAAGIHAVAMMMSKSSNGCPTVASEGMHC